MLRFLSLFEIGRNTVSRFFITAGRTRTLMYFLYYSEEKKRYQGEDDSSMKFTKIAVFTSCLNLEAEMGMCCGIHVENIECFIEGRTIRLLAHPLPTSSISNLPLSLILPVCRGSSLLTGGRGTGWARSQIIQPQESHSIL